MKIDSIYYNNILFSSFKGSKTLKPNPSKLNNINTKYIAYNQYGQINNYDNIGKNFDKRI